MDNPLVIKDWLDLFENSESRKLIHMRWVPIPNKHDGMGYGQLWQEKRAVDIFAAWILMLQVASKCKPRGTLINKDGQPITPTELSVKTRAPKEIFELAIPVLLKIGWISGDSTGEPGDSTDTPVGNRIEGKGIEQKGINYSLLVDECYQLYPTKCSDGRPTGKCQKDRVRIESILRAGEYPLKEAIELYVKKTDPQYYKNFGTFLNQRPDVEALRSAPNFENRTPRQESKPYQKPERVEPYHAEWKSPYKRED